MSTEETSITATESAPATTTADSPITPAPAPAPPTPAPADTGTQIPEYTPDAAAALDAAYSITAPETNQEQPQNTPAPAGDNPSDYAITFPENFIQDSEAQTFNTILAPIAKQSGISGEAFGKLFADSYAAIETARQQAEWRNRFQQDIDLKKDWGADYEANMNTARGHIEFLKQKAGLSESDLAVFSSPKGMRALYAMATSVSTPPAAGLSSTAETDANWAKAIMNSSHPDHEAFTNPMHPRYKETNKRWLKANGF